MTEELGLQMFSENRYRLVLIINSTRVIKFYWISNRSGVEELIYTVTKSY